MSHHGLPCWYELASADVTASEGFYSAILGWTWADSGMPTMTYLLAKAEGDMVAGMMAAEHGMPVAWTFYVAVDDADALAAKAAALGATVIVPPTDIPNTGRFSILIDPQGASFAVLQPLPGGTGGAFDQKKAGHGNWHDLACADTAAALAFYGALFGWTVTQSMPMGPDMTYNIIAANGQDIGGVFNATGAPAWCVYFGSSSVQTATEAIKAKGGQIIYGPAEVPGGAYITQANDPQGTRFAVVGPM